MIVNYPRMRRRASWPSDLDTALEFTSPEVFSISAPKNWDGKIEYTNGSGWQTWDGSVITSSEIMGNHCIYLRGTGNTKITGAYSSNVKWSIIGANIACNGDIDLLLDYSTVKSEKRPAMADYCYSYMFEGCTSLTTAPALPATTLANYCYTYMFNGCTNLTTAPALPATTLASNCYSGMFEGCKNLTTAPALPATTLASNCYGFMFNGCTSLTTAPALPATTLAYYCYGYMFKGCTSLTTAPALPATTLANYCYTYMFNGCTNLTTAPALPATTLASNCYSGMFEGCKNLTTAPALPATTLASNCYYRMFYSCRKIKLSSTASGTYTKAYRIPKSGTGTMGTNSMSNMFTNTGGTFKGTPKINTTYYLDASNTIV